MPGQWQINFVLSNEAAKRFGPFTEQNRGRQMAIVLEHQVYSAPTIQSRIEDQGRIDGNFSQEAAHDLALVLRAGALPASIKYRRAYRGAIAGRRLHPSRRAGI